MREISITRSGFWQKEGLRMEIKSIHELYQLRTAKTMPRPGKKTREELAPKDTAVDTITISKEASFRAQLATATRQYAAEAQNIAGASPARMDSLKAAYAGDQCPVSGADIWKAMAVRSMAMPSQPEKEF